MTPLNYLFVSWYIHKDRDGNEYAMPKRKENTVKVDTSALPNSL